MSHVAPWNYLSVDNQLDLSTNIVYDEIAAHTSGCCSLILYDRIKHNNFFS